MRLMERGPHGTRLTAAGRTFVVEAQALPGVAADAVARVRAIASKPRIVVGYASNLIVTPAAQMLRDAVSGRRGGDAAPGLGRAGGRSRR